jgi:streptogrisin C
MEAQQFKRTRLITGLVAVLTILAAATASPGAALDGTTTRAGHEVDIDLPNVAPAQWGSLDSAQLNDLATVAKQEGISLELAVEEYGWHESFSMLVNGIRQTYPDDFAGARIERNGDPWIAFRSTAPEAAVVEVARFNDAIFGSRALEVRMIENRGFSERELDDRLLAAHYSALSETDLVDNASSGYDIATGVITVEVQLVAASDTEGERDEILQDIVLRNPKAFLGVEVRAIDQVLGGATTNIFGGHYLAWSENGDLACTSGFGVKSGSTRGLVTAGHCGDSLYYVLSGTDAHLVTQDQEEGPYGDVQWMTSSAYEADDFFSGPYDTNLLDVSGTGYPTEGQELCRNGSASGKTCDHVYQLNHCFGGVCHLTLTNTNTSIPGDSGGPWYWGHTAYGVHQGRWFYWFAVRSTFTPVVFLPYSIDVEIATS